MGKFFFFPKVKANVIQDNQHYYYFAFIEVQNSWAGKKKQKQNNKNVSYGQKQMPKSTVSNSYTKLK